MALHYLRNSRHILEELLEKASIQGYLTCEDLVDASPQVDNDSERQSDLLQALLQRGVEVLESERELETPAEYPHLEMDAWAEPALTDTSMQDSVGMYFKDMSCVPLLSIPEEVELALRIETGRAAAAKLAICPGRGRKQEKQRLEVLMQDGIQAREHLIKANTRLVVSIAKRHMGRGVAFLDLIQEGNMGLMKAVEKYDVHRGFRFSTYATWWIRQTISRAIYDQARTIRLPVHMNDRIRHIYKASRSLEQRLGRVPTHEELASEVGISVEKLRWIMMV